VKRKKKDLTLTRNMLTWRIKGLEANINSFLYIFKDLLTKKERVTFEKILDDIYALNKESK